MIIERTDSIIPFNHAETPNLQLISNEIKRTDGSIASTSKTGNIYHIFGISGLFLSALIGLFVMIYKNYKNKTIKLELEEYNHERNQSGSHMENASNTQLLFGQRIIKSKQNRTKKRKMHNDEKIKPETKMRVTSFTHKRKRLA